MNQPLAYVHSDAKIAKNGVIEPFTTIDKHVVIGAVSYTHLTLPTTLNG